MFDYLLNLSIQLYYDEAVMTSMLCVWERINTRRPIYKLSPRLSRIDMPMADDSSESPFGLVRWLSDTDKHGKQ